MLKDEPNYDESLRLDMERSPLDFFNSSNWIVFESGPGELPFIQLVEEEIFTPGTTKNAEFEILICPKTIYSEVTVPSAWYRFWDTLENRKWFEEVFLQYFNRCLPENWYETSITGKKLLVKCMSLEGNTLKIDDKKLAYLRSLSCLKNIYKRVK